MHQNRFTRGQVNSEYLVITLRKLVVKKESLQNCKVSISLKLFENQSEFSPCKHAKKSYENSQARPIKNGVAYFYGESIVITERVSTFNIIVYLVEDQNVPEKAVRRQLAQIEIGSDEISEISKKKCSFSSGSDALQLIWQAKLQHERIDMPQEYQDRSLEDFIDIEENKQADFDRQLLGRKMYSPAMRGENRRQQRSSSRRKKDNSRFELVSESPHKLTMDTNETLISLKKKIKLMSPTKNKNDNYGLKQFRREIYQEPKTKEKVREIQIEGKTQEIKEQKVYVIPSPEVSPRKNSKPDLKKFNTNMKSPLTPQHSFKNSVHFPKKKTERFYERINLRSLLYTSVIGIIGGVAATQF